MHKVLMVVLAIMVSGCAGMLPIAEADRTFNAVFETPGSSKDKIFNATKVWIAENFRSAKAVIEYENKEEGTLIGNGVIPYPCSGLECVAKANWTVPFTMRVDMKEQKFKLTFTNISIARPPLYANGVYYPAGNDPIQNQGDLDSIKPKLLGFGNALISSIHKDSGSKNW